MMVTVNTAQSFNQNKGVAESEKLSARNIPLDILYQRGIIQPRLYLMEREEPLFKKNFHPITKTLPY